MGGGYFCVLSKWYLWAISALSKGPAFNSASPFSKTKLSVELDVRAQETFAKLKIEHFWDLSVRCQGLFESTGGILPVAMPWYPSAKTILILLLKQSGLRHRSGARSWNSSVIVFHAGYHRSISHFTLISFSPIRPSIIIVMFNSALLGGVKIQT